VDVPAKLTVDGKTYQDVGVHFRGASSFGVGEGRKRSINVSLDFAHSEQQLGGYRTLNLLNSHRDPSFLRSILYYQIAREYIPAPKANFARVVINGESWGVYVNAQQFDRDFVKDWFGTTKGARWKVPGSPGGRGNLAYLGDDVAPYKQFYEIKSKDSDKSWAKLIKLCKVLNETPPEKLEQALTPLLNIDGALKFLAIENTLVNNDGYWIRTSDYNIYEDEKGRFHIVLAVAVRESKV
jgi:spore coat protein CotH